MTTMANEASKPDRVTTFLSVTGVNNQELQFLANLSPPISESESNWSVIGNLAHRPDIGWTKIYEFDSWLTSMDRSVGGSLFAVSLDGRLHSNHTGAWGEMDLRCPGLNSVWAATDDGAFAVGEGATRVRIAGMGATAIRGTPQQRLNAVHGTSPENVLAVGDNGLIMRFDGANWIQLDPPTNYNLLAVLCRSQSEAYIAGAGGVLLRYDGTDFEHLVKPGDLVITGLAWYRDALHAAAGQGGVHVLTAIGLDQIKPLILYKLRTIGDLLFGWGNNLIAQFDGSGWWGGRIDL
jgi:hypothetical protein